MNNDSKPFKQAVKSYYESKNIPAEKLLLLSELSDKIGSHATETKNSTTHKHKTGMWSLTASAIAASLIVTLFTIGYNQQPEIITAAYDDAIKDANLFNGLASQQKEWIAVNHIAPAPAEYEIEMSSFCNLSGHKTTHLRIADRQQEKGKINVFFKIGQKPYLLGRTSGKKDNMYWKVLKAKDNLTVIVLYSEDMHEKAVNNIIHNMLPGITV